MTRSPSTAASVSLAGAVIAILEPRTRALRFASAGHPPVLRSRPEATDFLPNPDGILLGASSDATYGVHAKELRPGTTLLFFTDGLIESRHSSLAVGMDELTDVATLVHGEGPNALCDAVLHWRVGVEREDDVCILAVRLQ